MGKGGKALLIVAVLVVAGGVYGRNTVTTSPAAPAAKPTAIATPTPRPATVRPSAVVSLAQAHGQRIAVAEDTGPLRCDYTLDNTRHATVVWTDGALAYTIGGEPNALGLMYMDMLALDAWQSCAYSVKDHARIGYGGAQAADARDTLEAYGKAFQKATGVAPTPAPTPIKYEYVINRERKMFHWPTCYAAKRLKGKNRRVVTTSREKLIEKGYEPCGNCNP